MTEVPEEENTKEFFGGYMQRVNEIQKMARETQNELACIEKGSDSESDESNTAGKATLMEQQFKQKP